MKVHFIGIGTKLSADYKKIISIIKKLGHKVSFQLSDKEEEFRKPTKLSFDILIAEISKDSTSLGYKIAQALSQKISVLCLYPDSVDFSQLPGSIRNSNSEQLTLRPYNKAIIKKTLKDYLTTLEKQDEARFNFILPNDLIEYLEWVPFNKKKHKAAFIRGLIREQMEKDEEYRVYIKNRK